MTASNWRPSTASASAVVAVAAMRPLLSGDQVSSSLMVIFTRKPYSFAKKESGFGSSPPFATINPPYPAYSLMSICSTPSFGVYAAAASRVGVPSTGSMGEGASPSPGSGRELCVVLADSPSDESRPTSRYTPNPIKPTSRMNVRRLPIAEPRAARRVARRLMACSWKLTLKSTFVRALLCDLLPTPHLRFRLQQLGGRRFVGQIVEAGEQLA